MRFFFRSLKFKIFIVCFSVLLICTVVFSVIGGLALPGSNIFGSIISPIQNVFVSASEKVDNFNNRLKSNDELLNEIDELRTENEKLETKLAEYDKLLSENEHLKESLGVIDSVRNVTIKNATVFSRDYSDVYKGFTINVGLIDNVAINDPVVTSNNVLIGVVSEVGLTYSKVKTIIHPDFQAAGIDAITNDSGVIGGKTSLSVNGKLGFFNLKRDCSVSIGHTIVTFGGSVFPKGLVVGTVSDIRHQEKDSSLYAEIEPLVDFEQLKQINVITHFEGQGSSLQSGEPQ